LSARAIAVALAMLCISLMHLQPSSPSELHLARRVQAVSCLLRPRSNRCPHPESRYGCAGRLSTPRALVSLNAGPVRSS